MVHELPLFPLNTVLFPGMPLTVHIFEERYKALIGDCMKSNRQFGVVLIRDGMEALGPVAEPHLVGCTAEIAQVQPLLGGRMNILVIGGERFRIVSLRRGGAYLQGTVESFPLDMLLGAAAHDATRRLRPWVEEYLALLSEAGDVDFDADKLPNDPEGLAYLAATVLQVPNLQKQELLATPGAVGLLSGMRDIYRRELPVLRLLLQDRDEAPLGVEPFSLN